MPDDDDRPRDAAGAADPNGPVGAKGGIDWTQISAPDDLSGLSRDVKSYHRECRATRRRERFSRLSARPSTAPLTMTATALVMAGVVALLLTVMSPSHTRRGPSALPVATPTVATGQTGGQFPNVPLSATTGKVQVAAQALRPAVVVSIPTACDCTPLLKELANQAYEAHGTRVVVVASTGADASALSGQLPEGAVVYYDPTNSLRDQLGAVGVTVALQDRDGTIYGPIHASVTQTGPLDLTSTVNTMLEAKSASG